MRRRRRRSAGPIYAFIAAWIVCALVFPLFTVGGLLISLLISAGVCFGAGAIIAGLVRKNAPEQPEEQEPEKPRETGCGPEVDGIIADGRVAMQEMGRLYASIDDPDIRVKINEIMRVSDKIVQDAVQDPSDAPAIRKFLNYYLPTTIKLLNAYDRMSATGIQGENVTKTMSSITEMLDTTIVAYKKQLDSLFANQAMDIETDIAVMNRLMARQGLAGGELDDIITKAARGESSSGSAAAAQKDIQ